MERRGNGWYDERKRYGRVEETIWLKGRVEEMVDGRTRVRDGGWKAV